MKLPNGNVANRVLPVRIYNLDNADIKLCETVLGGVLRGIEFIYAEPGVNRPLKPDDDEKINLNRTRYRNQINKVGNTIKEIIAGLLSEPIEPVHGNPLIRKTFSEVRREARTEAEEKSTRKSRKKLLSGVSIFAILIITAFFAYPKLFKRDILDSLRSSGDRISVAVMPFQNMTGDSTLSNWQDDIQYNLIVYLSNFKEELTVRGRESIANILLEKGFNNYNSISTAVAGSISQRLDADIFIYGSINQSGSTIRLNAQLIDSKTGESLKAFQIDRTVKDKFALVDSLSVMVKNVLIISKLEKEFTPDFLRLTSVNSPEAFRYFISGQNAFNERDWSTAAKLYSKATALDSNFIYADLQLIYALGNQGLYAEAKKHALKLYNKRDQMPMQQRLVASYIHAMLFENPYEEIKYLKQELEFDDQLPSCYFGLGIAFRKLNLYDKAIPEYEKALEIYDKWGVKPMWTGNYSHLASLYHNTGRYEKERELYKKAEIDFPDNSDILEGQAIMSLSEGDTVSANRFINKYISIRKEKSVPEASITTSIAGIYSAAGIIDKAEIYFRQALSSEPENPFRMNALAYFLIDKNRNIDQGMELIDEALKLNPEDYNFLFTKGLGLYKQGKYIEAVEILQKSWDLRLKNAVYYHDALLQLEAAKKNVADRKQNN